MLTDADKRQAETDLRKETDMSIKDVERYAEEATERLRAAWDTFRTISVRQIIGDEQLFREMRERFGSQYGFGEYFKGGMGASAIRDLLEEFDLDAGGGHAPRDDPHVQGAAPRQGAQAPARRLGVHPQRQQARRG